MAIDDQGVIALTIHVADYSIQKLSDGPSPRKGFHKEHLRCNTFTLKYIHIQSVTHGGFKPSNIVFSYSGEDSK